MITVYAIALGLGCLGLIALIFSAAFSASNDKTDLGDRLGLAGRTILGGVLGFGMGGMAAEFSPLDFSWAVSLVIAVAGLLIGVAWTRYAVRKAAT